MIDDPGTPEYIPGVEEKKVNLSSAVMVQGKENDIISSARRCELIPLFCFSSFIYFLVQCGFSRNPENLLMLLTFGSRNWDTTF